VSDLIRDPLWDNIELDQAAMMVLDTDAVQRLRYVRQLGHAFLVYPGASHTRFEHALGAYHLATRALAILAQRGDLASVPEADRVAVRLAALVHDVGHYPFSHGLEEAGFPHHERLGVAKLSRGQLGRVLDHLGGPALVAELSALITGTSAGPLQGLISGTLDLDKIDYLSRDARACGVPYGTLDVDRLLSALTVMPNPSDGRLEVGILEKGISALETLLFAKYQMYRNVYWHHAVRSATCMFKRAVRAAVAGGGLSAEELAEETDGALMERLFLTDPTGLARAVHQRRLFKRALDLPASEIPSGAGDWLSDDPNLVEAVEDALVRELGLGPASLLLDFPARANMFAVDLPLLTREGRVERLTGEGRAGHLGLPRVADELYRSARRFRVFAADPVSAPPERIIAVVSRADEWLRERLAAGLSIVG
jgi:hypothetical protein